jgi:hypothetical protein
MKLCPPLLEVYISLVDMGYYTCWYRKVSSTASARTRWVSMPILASAKEREMN